MTDSHLLDPRALAALFARGAPMPVSEEDALGDKLVEILSAAAATWPTLAPGEGFITFLAARLEPEEPPLAQLEALRTNDLFLAWACVSGDAAAVAAFEAHCMPGVIAAVARMENDGALLDDVAQSLRDKLLVGDGESPPKLTEYRGRGELRGWVRVSAVRQALNWRRKLKHESIPGDEVLENVASPEDPELAFLKGHYQQEFKAAFHAALAALDRDERNLLRSRLLDDLSIDELGLLYGIHRSTAARRLEQVRHKLQAKTRRILQDRLKISPLEFESIARLVMSRFDASVRRVLTEGDD